MIKTYIGIDPGQSGGLALIKSTTTEVTTEVIDVIKMPATEFDIWTWFLNKQTNCFAIIEKVHSMPGQGVASTFKFGKGYGGLRMALVAAGIPFEEVAPRMWQKSMGISSRLKTESKTEFKNRLKSKAQQLFPHIKITLAI